MKPDPAPTRETPIRLPMLDGLRTIAALGVMLFHVPVLRGEVPYFGRAYLLVDLFFLLSGFVLTLSAEPRLRCGQGTVTFVALRFRRFWPLMALGSIMGALVFATSVPVVQIGMLLPLALLAIPLPNSIGAPLFPLNGPQWSLFWELVANFFHALLLRRLSDSALLALAILMGALLVAATLWNGTCDFGAVGSNWWMAIFRIGWSYTLGSWIARRWVPGHGILPLPWWGVIVLPVAATCLLPLLPYSSKGLGDAITVILVYPLCFRLIIAVEPPQDAKPLLERIGELSFPLYVTHVPIILAFRLIGETVASGIAGISVALLASILIAALAKPVRRTTRQFIAGVPWASRSLSKSTV